MSFPSLKIDNVCVFPTFRETGLLASCSVMIDNLFQVNDIKLFQGETGLFLRYPSRLGLDGKRCELCAPAHRLHRFKIRQTILRAYKKALQRAAEEEIQLSLFPQAA